MNWLYPLRRKEKSIQKELMEEFGRAEVKIIYHYNYYGHKNILNAPEIENNNPYKFRFFTLMKSLFF